MGKQILIALILSTLLIMSTANAASDQHSYEVHIHDKHYTIYNNFNHDCEKIKTKEPQSKAQEKSKSYTNQKLGHKLSNAITTFAYSIAEIGVHFAVGLTNNILLITNDIIKGIIF